MNRVCSVAGCPVLYEKAEGTRCRTHRAAHERTRGTKTERGYGSDHVRLRAQWAPRVARGHVLCAKCGKRIPPATDWHLGHNDDRTAWTGPEHATCNLSDAGRRSHQ